MNPDVFSQVEIPERLKPYFRRAMVAAADEPVDLSFVVRGSGYCYLGWTPSGRWEGVVNDKLQFDTDRDGPFHLSGQVFDGQVACRSSGKLRQVFCEFTALGQYELLGVPGIQTFERAVNPIEVVPALAAVRKQLDESSPSRNAQDLSSRMFEVLSTILPARTAPTYIKEMVEQIERCHGDTKIGELLANAPVSERKARNDFGRIVGLPPKRFSKLLQINYAFGAMIELGDARLAELALECGFSDQAHLTRSFAEFLGNSPVRFSKDIEPTLKRFVGLSRRTNQDHKFTGKTN